MLQCAFAGKIWGIGTALLCAIPALRGDTAAGLKAFRQGDYATALREWKAEADKGQSEAEYNLGMLYLKGQSVAPDTQEALRLFRLAAEQGQPDAQFQLGLMREKGVGVPQNYAEAEFWFALAAGRGDPEAESGLAGLYEQGYGVEKDLKRAAQMVPAGCRPGVGGGPIPLRVAHRERTRGASRCNRSRQAVCARR
jgi:hypothetical protein